MKIVESFGHIWRLSDAAYIEMLRGIANDTEIDLNVLGTHIGAIECPCIATMTSEMAADLLVEALKPKPRKKST